MTRQPPHVLVAGGGVAAVEAVAALRALVGPEVRITLLAPDRDLTPRAASVAAPFGFGAPAPLPFAAIRRHAPFELHRGTLARVEPGARIAFDDRGEPIAYDKLLIAVGARPERALPGAITFAGPDDAPAVARALEEAARVAFVLPVVTGWALPVYELAIMAALEGRAEITVVTPEPQPLWLFGPQAGEAVRRLLAERGIALRTGACPQRVSEDGVELDDGTSVPADRVIALPRLAGPAVPGLPRNPEGFLPVDAHGRVPGVSHVFGAGDATTFPLKQGGLATQQADVAAAMIAAELGAAVKPEPFRPVLRGLLLTGGAPLYLRSVLTLAGAPETRDAHPVPGLEASVSQRALWWPPSKIAGRYLAPLLATARPPVLASAPLTDNGPAGADARELALALAAEDDAAGDVEHAKLARAAAELLTPV